MNLLMDIAAVSSVQIPAAVKFFAYNIRGNPCSREKNYREIRFDILNLNAKISKEPLPGGSFFDCKKVCRETDEKICRILETNANLHCSLC